jgi:hypothetical protein
VIVDALLGYRVFVCRNTSDDCDSLDDGSSPEMFSIGQKTLLKNASGTTLLRVTACGANMR